MGKNTYYLSVGYLRYNYGREIPRAEEHITVETQKDVLLPLPQEVMLWTALKHKPLTYEEMRFDYEALLDEYDVEESISFEECLRHLCGLGIVITGNGEDEIEAQYDLMRDVLVLPFPETVAQRAKLAFHLATRKGVSLSETRSLFPKRRLSPQEAEVLALVRETPLTTAELVMLVECKTWSDETVNSIAESIGRYGGKAMKVYADMMYGSRYLEGVLDAVFALREDRRVAFM